jgi:hypothetical protein
MPHAVHEAHLRRLERVVLGEAQLGLEDAAFEGGALRPLEEGDPDEQVVLVARAGDDALRRVRRERLVLVHEPAEGGRAVGARHDGGGTEMAAR